MNIPARLSLLLTSALSILLFACQPDPVETATKGVIALTIPESIAPAMLIQTDEFLRIYKQNGAEIISTIGTSELAASRFVLDTAQIIFITRRLTDDEKTLVKRINGDLIELPVAYDGIVAAVHFKNKTEQATLVDLRGILSGTVARWEKLSRVKGMTGPITVYYQDSSDVSSYLRQRLHLDALRPARAVHTTSSLATLQRMVKDPGGIALVGLDWLDSAKVPAKVLELGQAEADIDTAFRPPIEAVGKFFSPHPAHIYRNYYPFKRGIYMYSKSIRGDLASGFGTYVANKEGQKLFLARNIVPATQPIRLKPSY